MINYIKNMENKIGRPTIFTKELGDLICSKIAEGESLRSICREEEMPNKATVFNWLRTNKEFLDQYELSMEERTIAMGEETIEISDDSLILAQASDPKSAGAIVQAQKLRVDTRKWLMSKMKPKKYGDKLDVMSDGKAIQGNTIIFKDFKDETDNQ